ncbi:MAG: hypothetical protein CSA36_04040 [Draconibacterium sp.]|nr:MAG: hypothetical protein CSA36_04040 [Draconibacterium sp.]
MNKVVEIAVVVAVIVVMLSCSTTKKITDNSQKNTVSDVIAGDTLQEQKRMEYEYLFVEALKQKMLGNPQNAVQILSGCLEIDPRASAAMYELANIHAANNDFTSASLLLEKAISIDDKNVWYKQLLAQIYQQTRRFKDAAAIYAQLLQKDPDNQEYLYTKAILLTNAKDYQAAIETYNQLERKTGINEQISVAKQQLYVLNGQADKAFVEIQKLIDSNPGESKYYGLLADLYLSQDDRENALKYYNKVLEMEPENGFVHFSLANYYLSENNIEKAFKETEEGFSNESVDLQTKIQMYIMLVTNRDKTSLTDSQEVRLIHILREEYPEEYLVHTLYADFLFRKEKFTEGREELLKALEIETGDYMVWERLLFVENDLQKWQALYEHSKEAVDVFPNQSQLYFMHALAALQLEKFDETVKSIDEGLDFVIEDEKLKGQFLMLKGEAAYKQDKLNEAFRLFNEALELDSENYIAMNNYAYYLAVAGRDLDKAERLSGKVVQQFPGNPTYLDTYAWVLFKKGEYMQAKHYMESAIVNGGKENPTLLEHLGDIFYMLKNTDEAVKFWKNARSFGGKSKILEQKIRERKYIAE